MKVIIYTNDAGKISVITPIDCGLTIEEIAEKDVPRVLGLNGITPRQYLILDDSLLPNRDDRDRWVIQSNQVIIDLTIPLPIPLPNWNVLYDRLLGGTLSSIFNRVNLAAIANPSITIGLLNMNGALTNVRVEPALASALQILKLSGYVFTPQEIGLWNTAIAELNFSNLVKL